MPVKLAGLISEDNIRTHMTSSSYRAALMELVGTFAEDMGTMSPEAICERLLQIEEGMATKLDHGVRIPHARLSGIHNVYLAIGTSRDGIPDDNQDEEKVHLIFILITPKTQSTLMLQTMASIARLIQNEGNRRALLATRSAQRVVRILEDSGIEVKKAIIGADLMKKPEYVLHPEMTLRLVVRDLVKSDEEGLPVIDDSGELLGDISTRMVIEVGLPKYMNLISNSKVLSEFEPFEAFYRKEDTLKAQDIMNPNVLRLAPETPVEIVAHEMLTHTCERAYIVEEKILKGVVYRKNIVRKVLDL